MQQNSETRWGTFKTALVASVAVHVIAAGFLIFDLPAPQPDEPEAVKVEMVPDPEKKPEPENKPEPKPQEDVKPLEKPVTKDGGEQAPKAKQQQQAEQVVKEQADAKTVEAEKAQARKAEAEKAETQKAEAQKPEIQKAETQTSEAEKAEAAKAEAQKPAAQPMQPQAFESASKDGGKEAGGDRPSEQQKTAGTEPRTEWAAPLANDKVPDDNPQVRKPLDMQADTPAAAKLPEVDLPQSSSANPVLNEGEALIETVPVPKAKPQEQPVDVATSDPQTSASADGADARPSRPPSDLKQASELYSADTLSDPRVRQALGKLPPNRRIIQICNFETLEQIRRARPQTLPEGLVPFADNGGTIAGQELRDTGGAFVSRRVWHDVEFECTVDEAFSRVTSFRFAIGKTVPEAERKARGLPDN